MQNQRLKRKKDSRLTSSPEVVRRFGVLTSVVIFCAGLSSTARQYPAKLPLQVSLRLGEDNRTLPEMNDRPWNECSKPQQFSRSWGAPPPRVHQTGALAGLP